MYQGRTGKPECAKIGDRHFEPKQKKSYQAERKKQRKMMCATFLVLTGHTLSSGRAFSHGRG
jgi:hypothetical protein